MDLSSSFRQQYRTLTSLPEQERRFLVYEPTDHTGWGNKLRGFTLALLLSLATRRILVIREFLLEEHFLPPEDCSWGYAEWRRELRALARQTTKVELHLSPSNWNEDEWQAYRTESMDALFPARVITLTEGTGFSDQLILNPHYAELWKTLGLDASSKLSWVGTVCHSFLNRPTEKLSRQLSRLRERVGLERGDRFGIVQFRTFFDIGSPRASLVEAFLNEVRRVLAEDGWEAAPIFIATDDARVTRALAEGLRSRTPTIVSPTRVVHTGYVHVGWVRLVERVLQKVLGRDFWIGDFWAWLPPTLRPRPHTAVLAEWFLYGEAELAISSFTSFAAFAMARQGNSARLYRFDADSRKVSVLTDGQYDF